MTGGWVRLYRSIFTGDMAPSKRSPACPALAFLWVVCRAQFSDNSDLKRGEVRIAVRQMAGALGWSKSRTSRFLLAQRERDRLRERRRDTRGTVYLVVNYDTYQSDYVASGTGSGTRAGRERDIDKKEEVKTKTPPRARKTSLPTTWEPTESHRARAVEVGVVLDREAEKFRLHAEANGRTQVSWNAAFTTWLIKSQEWAGNGNGRKAPVDLSHWDD